MTPIVLADNIEFAQISFIAGVIGVVFFVAAIVRIIRSRRIRTQASNREQAKANFGTENNPVTYSSPYVKPEDPPAAAQPSQPAAPAPSAVELQPQPQLQRQPLTAPSPPRPAPVRDLGSDVHEEAASDYEHFIWE